jgi:hypothetical protein
MEDVHVPCLGSGAPSRRSRRLPDTFQRRNCVPPEKLAAV